MMFQGLTYALCIDVRRVVDIQANHDALMKGVRQCVLFCFSPPRMVILRSF